MGISVHHNTNGSITVSCGTDTLTFFPGTSSAGAGAGGGGGLSGGPGPGVVPVIDPVDDPMVGWPLPGALSIVGGRNLGGLPGPGLPRFRVDRQSGNLQIDQAVASLRQIYGAHLHAMQTLPIAIDSAYGQVFELAPITAQLQRLQAQLRLPITPYLRATSDDEGF